MTTSDNLIKDSVFLVTGGGSGLGKATVEILLKSGGKVVICDLQLPERNDPIYQYGNSLLPFKADVTSEEDIQKLYVEIKREFGKLNGIVNCAGVGRMIPVYDFEKQEPHSLKDFLTMFNVNVLGTFNVIRLGIPLLADSVRINKNKEQSIIINTSSILGHFGVENSFAYSVSKGAIVAMTTPLAKELKDHGIRVVDIAPGIFETPLIEPFREFLNGVMPSAFPKRFGRPEEYAKFVKAIIEIPFINGKSMHIDAMHML